ncbi:hypothetical protein NWFMUON74_00100 [Nocardia wallacei]|uniref:Uncharacterized protein n=1 Tax=Nocardia wallacei TaxID=480035 RepID=A0A7G1KAN5_9NOCA|nr:hypothetical protein NWFMUON74_00100 [Nocardia wallacei]
MPRIRIVALTELADSDDHRDHDTEREEKFHGCQPTGSRRIAALAESPALRPNAFGRLGAVAPGIPVRPRTESRRTIAGRYTSMFRSDPRRALCVADHRGPFRLVARQTAW